MFEMSGFDSGSIDSSNEPSAEDVANYVREMQKRGGDEAGQPYLTSADGLTKYSGPLAVKDYKGPKENDPETGNLCMHGDGFVVFANGSTYKGSLRYDMLHGFGVLKDPNGNEYAGEWVEDQREGKARFTMADGTCYEGFYKNNKRHGKGRETDCAGNIFEGVFEQGDPISGRMEYAEGDIYVGELNKDWDRHGKGKFISIDTGTVLAGRWELDNFEGPC